jgi:hypothetical protein
VVAVKNLENSAGFDTVPVRPLPLHGWVGRKLAGGGRGTSGRDCGGGGTCDLCLLYRNEGQ